jgi:hypothetical protein
MPFSPWCHTASLAPSDCSRHLLDWQPVCRPAGLLLSRRVTHDTLPLCSKVLVLEFGEELEDAFTLMEVLREHGLPLLQVGRRICACALPAIAREQLT